MKRNNFIFVILIAMVLLIPSLSSAFGHFLPGDVYVMTNSPDINQVKVFPRNAKGTLVQGRTYATGGLGSGGDIDALGSQGSLVLTRDQRWLLAVNAGSNEISVFRVHGHELSLADLAPSNGNFPNSIAVDRELVYVLNAGDDPNITGFSMDRWGKLTALPDSIRDLPPGAYSQIIFDPGGRHLVITERGSNQIFVFAVSRQGQPAVTPVISSSSGIAPFGMIFDNVGHLLVAEAGSGAVSSYKIKKDGSLGDISVSVANEQAATCWIAGNKRGFVYTANTGSNTISYYKVRFLSGRVFLLDKTAGSGMAPIDMAFSNNGLFLYALNAADGTVGMFRIRPNGALTDLGVIGGLPTTFVQGIAAR